MLVPLDGLGGFVKFGAVVIVREAMRGAEGTVALAAKAILEAHDWSGAGGKSALVVGSDDLVKESVYIDFFGLFLFGFGLFLCLGLLRLCLLWLLNLPLRVDLRLCLPLSLHIRLCLNLWL